MTRLTDKPVAGSPGGVSPPVQPAPLASAPGTAVPEPASAATGRKQQAGSVTAFFGARDTGPLRRTPAPGLPGVGAPSTQVHVESELPASFGTNLRALSRGLVGGAAAVPAIYFGLDLGLRTALGPVVAFVGVAVAVIATLAARSSLEKGIREDYAPARALLDRGLDRYAAGDLEGVQAAIAELRERFPKAVTEREALIVRADYLRLRAG